MNYKKSDLVQLAKRENNKIRPYLLVNPLQGKHIPVSPSKTMNLFQHLTNLLYQKYKNSRLLIIGFAETATAIGSAIAIHYPENCYYIQTTREQYDCANYLYFTESHSHATEQKLITNRLSDILREIDYIIFAEDEVTTGNTIQNIIDILVQTYSDISLNFGIASILNSMDSNRINEFAKKGIFCTYILNNFTVNYEDHLNQFTYSSKLMKTSLETTTCSSTFAIPVNSLVIPVNRNPRFGIYSHDYVTACTDFSEKIRKNLRMQTDFPSSLLVLGAEEFMYPALLVAQELEKTKLFSLVRFHATTRSPILPSEESDYPFNIRYELVSIYDNSRITYIYNLAYYDEVIIIHDSHNEDMKGIRSLCQALNECGCRNIHIYKWGGTNEEFV